METRNKKKKKGEKKKKKRKKKKKISKNQNLKNWGGGCLAARESNLEKLTVRGKEGK